MIRSDADRPVRSLEECEPFVASVQPSRCMRSASAEEDKAALAIAREVERVRTIRLLVGGANED